ncbi:MAG: elongation factor P-like protein YeiP [Kiritimatiellae bacterium]|nr:elongation factor P-like protein YeiP [Kiritimatiellia bacterium]
MIRASELRKGQVVKVGGAPHFVEEIQVQTPSARGGSTLYKIRFRNVRTRQKSDQTYKGDVAIEEVDFERREAQFLYKDPSGYTFMDLTDYSQFTLTADDLADQTEYLSDGLEGLLALLSDGRVLGVELPPTVELAITETGPSMKGASATARTKPATLATGLVVQVPEYLETGTVIRVDTRTGEFLSRA